ncbi:hypothetical protein X551_02333 [Methylibium sp. T29]|nr:hypothetical protein X551_02333 [Methylibium sp. T29]EWS60212.1 hypothetical protein Y694_01998 [Methylibium sp. T29-B]
MRPGDLTPAIFLGSPVFFVASGVLHRFMNVYVALVFGAVIGVLAGLSLIKALRS